MAELYFNSLSLLSVILYFQIEMFLLLCYNNVIFLSKVLRVKKTENHSNMLVGANANSFFLFFFVVGLLCLKGGSQFSTVLFMFISIFVLKLNSILNKLMNQSVNSNILQFILPLFVGSVYFLVYIKSYLTLLFFIEVYGVLYYFCYLTSYTFTNQTILKYKNGLLMLLWNNFLTTFLLALGCFFITRESGTTSFAELALLDSNALYIYLFLLGLSWKLGLPIFHFFKLEVYKYLLKENVFLFSILTTIVNLIIVFFCLTQPTIFNAIYLHNYVIFVVLFASVLVLINLKLTNLLQFFALSGVLTMTTLLTVYLI